MSAALEHQLTWGEALVLRVRKSKGGMNPLVDAIRAAVGAWIGTRPTFAKLYDIEAVSEMDGTEQFRAWLVLTALGSDPDDWGIPKTVVPPAYDVKYLQKALSGVVRHQGLEPRTRWFMDGARPQALGSEMPAFFVDQAA